MSLHHSPKIVTDGLVFCVDPANPKSYSSGSTCKDLTLNNGTGTLTSVALSDDKGFLMSIYNASRVYFTRNFVNNTDKITFIVAVFCPAMNIGDGATFFSSMNVNYGGWLIQYYMQDSNNGYFQFYGCDNDGLNCFDTQYATTIGEVRNKKIIIAGSVNGRVIKLYINGILKATQTLITNYNINNQNLIELGYCSGPMNWTVDKTKVYESLIYNRVLTDNEILQNYNALKGKYKI
jgi:hypothetical protein